MKFAQILALAMLLGSIPFGYIAAYRKTGKKIGEVGLGTASLLKELGPGLLAVVTLLDFAKGSIPVYLAKGVAGSGFLACLVGAIAIVSHSFPYWFMFKPTSKATAVIAGALTALAPPAGLIAIAIGAAALAISRSAAIAALAGAIAAPILMRVFGAPVAYLWFSLFTCAYAMIARARDIQRLAEIR